MNLCFITKDNTFDQSLYVQYQYIFEKFNQACLCAAGDK